MMQSAFVAAIPVRSTTKQQRSVCLLVKMSEKRSPTPPPVPKKPQKTIRSNASFKNEFLAEFGRKGPGSRPSWDLRPKSLRADVANPETCDSCNGTGLMTCSFCSGTTFYSEDGKALKCPACKGEKLTCSVCFGTKKSIELEGKWWEKGVAALFRK